MTFAENGVVVALVWFLMSYVFAPVVKLFLADGTALQIVVTRAIALVLGLALLMLVVGLPTTADGAAWANFLIVGMISGLAAMGIHANVGPLPPIQTIPSRLRRHGPPPAP